MTRKLSILAIALSMLTMRTVPASASFHLMKIVEVFAGTATDPTAQYVMLQMYFSGQDLVAGRAVTVYDANGTLTGTFTFASRVANGVNLSTILIATPTASTVFGVTADLPMDPVLSPAGGAVCWANNVNCVAWGSFSAPNALPVAPGPPFNAPTGLVPDMAMHRTLSAGGAVTAFAFAAPAPKNNAGEVTAPTQTPTSPSEATPTATPTSVVPTVCAGDCNRSGIVDTGELITLSNIALGHANAAVCADGIPDGESVVVAVILQAVNRSLLGCGLTPERQGCIDSGGTVSSASCCTTAPDFPDTCAIGPCGCSPESSHPVHICACGVGACFNRTLRTCIVP